MNEKHTTRNWSEESPAAREERFRNIFQANATPLTISTVDEGRYIDVNDAFTQFTGYTRQETIGKTAQELGVWANWEDRIRLSGQIRAEGRIDNAEVAVRTKSGGLRTALISAVVMDCAGQACFIGSIKDITERKQTEENLHKSQERLDLALRATQNAVWDWDLHADTIYYSPNWWKMIGYAENELEVDPDLWHQCIHPDDLEHADRIIIEAIEKLTAFEMEVRLQHKQGHYVPVLIQGLVQRDEDTNAVRRVTGANIDLTERKQMEAQRRQWDRQQQQLQKAESLNRMAGAIAHRFNNLLAAVMGNLELVSADLAVGDETTSENLAEAIQATRQAAEVSNLMLLYLGQTTGGQELLNLSEVCRSYSSVLKKTLRKGIVLETEQSSPEPIINANATEIEKILISLVTNAAEAIGDPGGTIHLSLKIVSATQIPNINRHPIDWQIQSARFACLEVKDTGSGMATKDIEHIFDPFFSHKFVGRGMGLPVVLGLVRAHGGAIAVESDPGRGTVFRVYFPLSAELPKRQPATSPPATGASMEGTVLLVEDEERVRNLIVKMLSHLGFSVLTAKDGVDATAVFRKHRNEIRVVLCDLTMPRMNGWETILALRRIAPGLLIILCSGYDEARAMQGKHPERPQAFLHKPFGLRELKAALGDALG